jgi:hypothetical protein
MKKFALSLLVVSSLTLTNLYASHAGNKRIHHRGNPQETIFHAIEAADVATVKDKLRAEENPAKDYLDRAIQSFNPKKEDSAKVLSLIAKKVSPETVAATRQALLQKSKAKATPQAEKTRSEAALALLTKASRRSSSSLSE